MNVWFGLLMGSLISLAGLGTYFLAPRVGPNPIFGVRTGYSFANRAVWDQSNRFGGLVLTGVGLILLAVSGVFSILGISGATATLWLSGVMMVLLLAGTVWIFVYTRRLALDTEIARQVAPMRVPLSTVWPAVGSWVLLAGLTLALYPTLSPQVATHFDLAGQPNGWQAALPFTLQYIGLAGLITLMAVGVAWLAGREPIIGVSRLGRWSLDPRRGVAATAWSIVTINLYLALPLLDIAWYDWRGVHLMPLGWLTLVMTMGLLLAVAGIFVYFARQPQDIEP